MTEPAENATFVVDANTLFLLGNGPSLRGVNLHDLAPYATLGMNAAYRYWREIGWRPRYYACLDMVVGLSHKDAVAELIAETGETAIRRFLLRDNLISALGAAAASDRVINFDALRLAHPILRPNPITTGSHAALWAATAGFRKIVLMGVDGKYVERVEGARGRGGIELEIVEENTNPNYFFDGYQRKGDRYNIPNPRPGLHVEAWEAAATLLRHERVSVVNGNPDSEIRFFPWIRAEEMVEKGAAEIDEGGRLAPRFSAKELLAQKGPPNRADGIVRRLQSLLAHQWKPLLAATALTGVAAGMIIRLQGLGAESAASLIAVSLLYALSVMILTVRDVMSDHLGRLDQRITTLESALRDFDRRFDAGTAPVGEDEKVQTPERRSAL